jgi:hypothetical protein
MLAGTLMGSGNWPRNLKNLLCCEARTVTATSSPAV